MEGRVIIEDIIYLNNIFYQFFQSKNKAFQSYWLEFCQYIIEYLYYELLRTINCI